MTGQPEHVFLIDGSTYIYRAFYVMPKLTRTDGLEVGAVFGFCTMLWKMMREMDEANAPTHLAVVFDKGGPTFRHQIMPEYKGTRPPSDPDLRAQFPLIREAVTAFGLPQIEQQGFEADDLIATYSRMAVERGATCTIVSNDKDLMQLIGPGVQMFDGVKNEWVTDETVLKKFGVKPDKVIDVQALIGDTTDNVPGCPGIGVKTAAELIATYGTVEAVLANANFVKQPKRREALLAFATQVMMSKRLVTLDKEVPLLADSDQEAIGGIRLRPCDYDALFAYLEEMEFRSLRQRIEAARG